MELLERVPDVEAEEYDRPKLLSRSLPSFLELLSDLHRELCEAHVVKVLTKLKH